MDLLVEVAEMFGQVLAEMQDKQQAFEAIKAQNAADKKALAERQGKLLKIIHAAKAGPIRALRSGELLRGVRLADGEIVELVAPPDTQIPLSIPSDSKPAAPPPSKPADASPPKLTPPAPSPAAPPPKGKPSAKAPPPDKLAALLSAQGHLLETMRAAIGRGKSKDLRSDPAWHLYWSAAKAAGKLELEQTKRLDGEADMWARGAAQLGGPGEFHRIKDACAQLLIGSGITGDGAEDAMWSAWLDTVEELEKDGAK